MAHHQLDELDEKILKLIIGNARIPFLEVARECNVSGAAIHQRIQKLTNLGVIKGSEFIVDNTKAEKPGKKYRFFDRTGCYAAGDRAAEPSGGFV